MIACRSVVDPPLRQMQEVALTGPAIQESTTKLPLPLPPSRCSIVIVMKVEIDRLAGQCRSVIGSPFLLPSHPLPLCDDTSSRGRSRTRSVAESIAYQPTNKIPQLFHFPLLSCSYSCSVVDQKTAGVLSLLPFAYRASHIPDRSLPEASR